MGFDLRGEGYQLRAFARFAGAQDDAETLTLELLLRWVQGSVAPGARDGSTPRGSVASFSEILPPVRSALPGASFGTLRTRSPAALSAYLHRT